MAGRKVAQAVVFRVTVARVSRSRAEDPIAAMVYCWLRKEHGSLSSALSVSATLSRRY